jgi:HlyD family secretion protein
MTATLSGDHQTDFATLRGDGSAHLWRKIASEALARRLRIAVATSLVLLVVIFGWGSVAQLSGAIVAQGLVVIDSNSKKIQHQQGGIIGEILVRNGMQVAAGDPLIRLDGTQSRASLAIINSQLTELLGRKARLTAERDNLGAIPPLHRDELTPEIERIMPGEIRLFEARRNAAIGQKNQLAERIKQSEEEIKGLQVQSRAKNRELDLIHDELGRVSDLFKRKLIPVNRLLSIQRDEAKIGGEVGTLVSQIAKLGGQIAETRLQIISIDQNKFSDAQKELRDLEGRMAELQERKVAAEDQLRRIELRAPIDGVVHELNVHTVGGIVTPGEPLLLVVPSEEVLSVEVRVPTTDVDQIKLNGPCVLHFTAFNRRTTPEIKGRVTLLSADASRENQTGQYFYTVRIAPDPQSLLQLRDEKLKPGMPVEVFMETSSRTALSYLVKPVADQFNRAFRER